MGWIARALAPMNEAVRPLQSQCGLSGWLRFCIVWRSILVVRALLDSHRWQRSREPCSKWLARRKVHKRGRCRA